MEGRMDKCADGWRGEEGIDGWRGAEWWVEEMGGWMERWREDGMKRGKKQRRKRERKKRKGQSPDPVHSGRF